MDITPYSAERFHLERPSKIHHAQGRLATLTDAHRRLEAVLLRLTELADNLHLGDRSARARAVLRYMTRELPRHIEDEEALLALIERKGDVGAISDELRREHAAIPGLLHPVTRGLEKIGRDAFCGRPDHFTVEALVLCEFLRMHVRYVEEVLIPRATAALSDDELAAQNHGRGSRNGSNLSGERAGQGLQGDWEQVGKMAIIGRFATGIAHDLNNVLGAISGNLEIAERDAKSNAPVADRIAQAMKAVLHSRSLTHRLIAFARDQHIEASSIDLPPLVAETIELAKSGLFGNIDSEIVPGVWPCHADPVQLEASLLNLLVNARDAMPDGGRAVVRAFNARIRPDQWEDGDGPDLEAGDYVVLSVTDEGRGIPAEILGRVTERFFTTKAPGKGCGLGLSIVRNFAKQYGGALLIASTEGHGTTASLVLPRSVESAGSFATTAAVEASKLGDEGTILFVGRYPRVNRRRG